MFDVKHKSKIKNDKILRWRTELMPYSFEITYRPGNRNAAADALSRIVCASSTKIDLVKLHSDLCHPGVARFYHYIRTKNLPFSMDDVKSVVSSCAICCRVKPRFFRPTQSVLIQAIKPFDRLSMDFKGPLPSSTANKFLLVVVDEYSRFPFAFPCSDISSNTVISCLTTLFSIFGTPSYIHSDRGTAFMSSAVKQFLLRHGISSSRSTPYHPYSNVHCERNIEIVWKNIVGTRIS